MANKTALDYFVQSIWDIETANIKINPELLQEIYEKAKEKEFNDICDAFDNGRYWNNSWSGYSYYEEIFINPNNLDGK